MNLNHILAEMRTRNEALMPFEAMLLVPTQSKDAYGGTRLTFTEAGTARCRLNFIGNNPRYQDAVKAAGISAGEAYLVALPFGTEIPEEAHLLINGITYAVVTQLDARSYATQVRLLVQRVSPAGEIAQAETSVYPEAIDDFTD